MSPKPNQKLVKIGATQDLKDGQSKKFLLIRSDRKVEAFLIKKNGKFLAYLNLCRHWSVGLDYDDNEFFTEDGEWLICKNHGALYHPETGECDSGPCGGASLYRVPIIQKANDLFADLGNMDWGEE